MKFKKHISFLLAFFLLVSNVGLAFNVHYCGGEVASIEPVYLELDKNSVKDECCGEKIIKETDCCKDIIFHLQEKTENVLIKSYSISSNAVLLNEEWESIVVSQELYSSTSSVASYQCEANVPPFFKLYHQYLFYD